MARPNIIIYADGGAKPNPDGEGGWAALVICDGQIEEMNGHESGTSNSRMKLMAVFMALESLEDASKIELHIDSPYVKNGVTRWMATWIANGWHMAKGQPVKNQDLWEGLHEMIETHDIRWHWTKDKDYIPNLYVKRVEELVTAAREHFTAPPMVALTEDGVPKVDASIYVIASYRRGSWGAVVVTPSGAQEMQGYEANSTGNQAILIACAKMLESLSTSQSIAIYSTNDYLINGMSKWLRGWIKNDWNTASGEPVKNQEQWKWLLTAAQPHRIIWIYSLEFENPHLRSANDLVIDFE
jgi:ribonuclease HI